MVQFIYCNWVSFMQWFGIVLKCVRKDSSTSAEEEQSQRMNKSETLFYT